MREWSRMRSKSICLWRNRYISLGFVETNRSSSFSLSRNNYDVYALGVRILRWTRLLRLIITKFYGTPHSLAWSRLLYSFGQILRLLHTTYMLIMCPIVKRTFITCSWPSILMLFTWSSVTILAFDWLEGLRIFFVGPTGITLTLLKVVLCFRWARSAFLLIIIGESYERGTSNCSSLSYANILSCFNSFQRMETTHLVLHVLMSYN